MKYPDCRTDEYYNEKFLDAEDANIIRGFDWCVEGLESMLANKEVVWELFDIEGEDINLMTFLENHKQVEQALIDAFVFWREMERNRLITTMIDSYECANED